MLNSSLLWEGLAHRYPIPMRGLLYGSISPFEAGHVAGLTQTLAALTVTATGQLRITGVLSQTLGALTVTTTGQLKIAGVLSQTLAALTVTATGEVRVRAFPTTSAAWTTAFPGITAPIAIWTCQDAGSPLEDGVGANDLVENQALAYAATGETQPIGSPRVAVHFNSTQAGEWTGPADTTFGNIAVSGHMFLYLRCLVPAVGTGRSVAGKGTSLTLARWGLETTSVGLMRAVVGDGTNSATATTVSEYDDSTYFDIIVGVDSTADVVRVITLTENVSAALGAAMVTVIDVLGIAPAGSFHLGSALGRNVLAGTHISYAALFDVVLTQANLVTITTPV